MFLYWQLGGLFGPRRNPSRFGVFHEERVWDIDGAGWDLGIRPGMALSEMKWRDPDAVWFPWKAEDYRAAVDRWTAWLNRKAARWEWSFGEAPGHHGFQGWWEWPGGSPVPWDRWMQELLPHGAARLAGGVASHPLLARWVMLHGASGLGREWKGPGFQVWEVDRQEEADLWDRLPLDWVPADSWERKSWGHHGWTRLGEVAGLARRIQAAGTVRLQPTLDDDGRIHAERHWHPPLEFGLEAVLNDVAQELEKRLAVPPRGIRVLRLGWELGGSDPVWQERRWPTALNDARSLALRLQAVVGRGPDAPPEGLVVEGREIIPLTPAQLQWGFMAKASRRPTVACDGVRYGMAPSFREERLAFWDTWRWSRGRE